VTFFASLEDFYPGRLAVKDRDKTPRITGVILITFVGGVEKKPLIGGVDKYNTRKIR
jgi:hypothetical protein